MFSLNFSHARLRPWLRNSFRTRAAAAVPLLPCPRRGGGKGGLEAATRHDSRGRTHTYTDVDLARHTSAIAAERSAQSADPASSLACNCPPRRCSCDQHVAVLLKCRMISDVRCESLSRWQGLTDSPFGSLWRTTMVSSRLSSHHGGCGSHQMWFSPSTPSSSISSFSRTVPILQKFRVRAECERIGDCLRCDVTEAAV